MNSVKKRVAFLYFEEIHHIPHFLGLASELSKNSDFKIDILTYRYKHEVLFYFLDLLEAKNISVIQLEKPLARKIIDYFTGRKKPSSVFFFRTYKKILLSYDAVVFTEKNHKYLFKARKKAQKPFFIFTGHGPAGRDYSYIPELKLFDLHLLHGPLYKENLEKLGILAKSSEIIGYPKFDLINFNNKKTLFKDDKPIVIYNPHFNRLTSSWYKHGLEVLEYFYQSKEFNLIFAPHIYLFNRKGFLKPADIPQKYFEAENIFIDLGSVSSSDMSYALAADIYLGDVSSQVFEFVIMPRPCVFINSHLTAWQDDLSYRFWQMGLVIDGVGQLHEALQTETETLTAFKEKQSAFLEENFLIDSKETASQKGAKAIDNFLKAKLP
ncbi:MAG: CDP-glycerol glycerophosphotransferase family protein [Flavobacteriaceae bacterium]|nr:CDP-glycerol glycerophosphotransferase family protein [Flavobacteriaceae bacterium]